MVEVCHIFIQIDIFRRELFGFVIFPIDIFQPFLRPVRLAPINVFANNINLDFF